jgi:flavin-binding protein dodecin
MPDGRRRSRQSVIFGVGCPIAATARIRPVEYLVSLKKEFPMPQSTYKVIELIGTSNKSWEEAAKVAVEKAAEHLRELRVAEVVEMDMVINEGKIEAYRTKVKVSFKYEGHA